MSNLRIEQGSSTPDNLLYAWQPEVTTPVTVLSGQGVLKRGTVLGRITPNVPTEGTADGGNTGDGLLNAVVQKAYTKNGNYIVTCKEAVADGGVFSVVDPSGIELADAVVGTKYSSDQIGFLLNDGAADYVVDDFFTIAVVVGSLDTKIVNSGNSDGSEVARYVLLDDVDTTSENIDSAAAEKGEFDERYLIFGGTDVAATHKDAMRDKGLYTSLGRENKPTLGQE